jgi:hypothetical protein
MSKLIESEERIPLPFPEKRGWGQQEIGKPYIISQANFVLRVSGIL